MRGDSIDGMLFSTRTISARARQLQAEYKNSTNNYLRQLREKKKYQKSSGDGKAVARRARRVKNTMGTKHDLTRTTLMWRQRAKCKIETRWKNTTEDLKKNVVGWMQLAKNFRNDNNNNSEDVKKREVSSAFENDDDDNDDDDDDGWRTRERERRERNNSRRQSRRERPVV